MEGWRGALFFMWRFLVHSLAAIWAAGERSSSTSCFIPLSKSKLARCRYVTNQCYLYLEKDTLFRRAKNKAKLRICFDDLSLQSGGQIIPLFLVALSRTFCAPWRTGVDPFLGLRNLLIPCGGLGVLFYGADFCRFIALMISCGWYPGWNGRYFSQSAKVICPANAGAVYRLMSAAVNGTSHTMAQNLIFSST